MYKDILKEIGAEESYMEYLFEESDDEDNNISSNDDEGDGNGLLGDLSRREASMSETDNNMSNHWESETGKSTIDDPNKISRDEGNVKTSSMNQSNASFDSLPSWKQMLQVATAKQEQIMDQMISLQQAQKESSPRNRMKNLEEADISKENNDNDPTINSSMVSSSTLNMIQKMSTRNAKLQGQWKSQQEKSNRLQDKLNIMQTSYYSQQEQWEKEKQELFSPVRSPDAIRSPSKIPKWGSAAKSSTPSKVGRNTFDERLASAPNFSADDASAEELELSKALIMQLEVQLEEARKVQQSQKEELRDCKDRLAKRDVEHEAFLLRYETEKKSWQDESTEKETQYKEELQSRDADLEDTRQKLQEQIFINEDLREKHLNDSRELALTNQKLSETEASEKQLAYIRELEEENQRLKTDSTHKEELQKTQEEIKLQMKTAIEEQTAKTREFQSRIRELEGRHAEEVEYWKSEVENHRKQNELNSTRIADLERKHDKEVKEWQTLLDADITKAVEDEPTFEYNESKENLSAIGAGTTGAETLSPIRKVPQQNDDNAPNESINMIDDLLHELGEMDVERTAILEEIKNDISQMESNNKSNAEEELPKADVSDESEVLDETLHLLNNLKTMLTSQENVKEHETTVIEQLEVLSELIQSQDQSNLEAIKNARNASSSSAVVETSLAILESQENAKELSWHSAVEAAGDNNPWIALVAELRNRCAFLERDRDEVARITGQILEMERTSHKAELEAAVAEVERKANENLHRMQLESNQEMNAFYQNICFQCEDEAFDYSDGKEKINLN